MKSKKRSSSTPLFVVLLIVVALAFIAIKLVGKIAHAFGSVQATGSVTIPVDQDTYIRQETPNGAGNFKIVSISNVVNKKHEGLLRFVVTGLPSGATITSANVRLYASAGSFSNGSTVSAGYLCRAIGANVGVWSETSLTWNSTNKPTPDCTTTFNLDVPGTPGVNPGETKVSGDLASTITGNGTYEYYVYTSSDEVSYASSEADTGSAGPAFTSANVPSLSITWSTTESPTNTPAPTPTSGPTATPDPVASPTPTAEPIIITPIPTITVSLTHGPIAGAVTHNSAKVFFRAPSLTTADVTICDTIPSGCITPQKVTLALSSTKDWTGIASFTNLQPNSTYYYWFGSNDAIDPQSVYQLTTFPDPTTAQNFSFAIFSDLSSQTATQFDGPGYITAANMNPAFVGQIGDINHAPDPLSDNPVSINSWWNRFKLAYSDSAQPSGKDFKNAFSKKVISTGLYKTTPFFHTWDDHDYGKNNADKTTLSASQRTMMLDAFTAYVPNYPFPNDPYTSTGGSWQKFQYGNLAEVYLLDDRSQRDPNSMTVTDPNKTLLGSVQKTWLKNNLTNSTATWKFIVSGSNWNKLGKGINEPTHGEDSWALYVAERQELVDFIKSPTNPIKNVIFITGDIHLGGAYDDGTHSDVPELSIPHTNINQQTYCTGNNIRSLADCGTWTRVLPGKNNGGFGFITVSPTTATLKVYREDGLQQFSYDRTAQ